FLFLVEVGNPFWQLREYPWRAARFIAQVGKVPCAYGSATQGMTRAPCCEGVAGASRLLGCCIAAASRDWLF
ncbi:hypothetical protein HAX54_034815, partial [Datura stramonium]|nr:hypothetical protein [Datura stramonium]